VFSYFIFEPSYTLLLFIHVKKVKNTQLRNFKVFLVFGSLQVGKSFKRCIKEVFLRKKINSNVKSSHVKDKKV